MKVVVDSSVFIDFFRAKKGDLYDLTQLARQEKLDLYVPTVVVAELWSGLSMSEKNNENLLRNLLRPTKMFLLTRQLAENAGLLMRQGKIIDFVDAVVAATTVGLGASLATGNKKHFSKIKGIKLFEIR